MALVFFVLAPQGPSLSYNWRPIKPQPLPNVTTSLFPYLEGFPSGPKGLHFMGLGKFFVLMRHAPSVTLPREWPIARGGGVVFCSCQALGA